MVVMDYKEAIKIFAKSGGLALKKKRGIEHYKKIGFLGAEKRWGKRDNKIGSILPLDK